MVIPKGTRVRLRTVNGGESLCTLHHDYGPACAGATFIGDDGHGFSVMADRIKSVDPVVFTAMEFFGRGDPFFGGNADDRPLGKDGRFMRSPYGTTEVAEFATLAEAMAAAEAAVNRREGALLSAFETPAHVRAQRERD